MQGDDAADSGARLDFARGAVIAAVAALLAGISAPASSAWATTLSQLPTWREEDLRRSTYSAPEALILEQPSDPSALLAHGSHRSHSSHSSHASHTSGSGHHSHYSGTTGVTPPAPAPPKTAPTPPPAVKPATPPVTTTVPVPRRAVHPLEVSARTVVEELAIRPEAKSFLGAMATAGIATAAPGSGPRLILLPSSAAYEAFVKARASLPSTASTDASLDDLVRYHVIPVRPRTEDAEKGCVLRTLGGQGASVRLREARLVLNQAATVIAEIQCTDGSILLLDDLLQPSSLTVTQQLRQDGRFALFVAALDASGMAEMLSEPWPFTVLAPTDDAIRATLAGAWMDLLRPESAAQLRAFVKRHLVAGRVFSDELRKLPTVTTGETPQAVAADGEVVHVGRAAIDQRDWNAKNGVIHVLSRPLVP